jgi:hypothetical protein
MSSKLLEVRFDLERKELMIRFMTKEQARAYQIKNPESRIFTDVSPRDVWLPVLPSMRYIRASFDGLAICFTSAETATRWCDRSIIGVQRDHGTEVFLRREWEEDKLDRLLRSDVDARGRLLDPRKARHEDGRPVINRFSRSVSPGVAIARGYRDGRI